MNKVAKQSEDLYQEKIDQLKKIYPALFNDEGNLNEDELKSFLKQFASTSEGKYEFNWAGKMSSKRNAFTTSRAMLKPDKERSVDFDNTENLIIEGDNLEVLKLLQKSYQGKIKCIYIDPPYNTGNDFIYTDNFSEDKNAYWEKSGTIQDGVKLDTNTESQGRYHSNWLNMIYSRLLIARNLLKEDGVIFISIDDNEMHNLRKVMDEIYGEENFVNCISVSMSNLSGPKIQHAIKGKRFPKIKEYLILYAKNKENYRLNIPKVLKTDWDSEYNIIVPDMAENFFEELNEGLSKVDIYSLKCYSLNEYMERNNIDSEDINWKWKNSYKIFASKPNEAILDKAKTMEFKSELAIIKSPSGQNKLIKTDFNRETRTARIELVSAKKNEAVFVGDQWIDIATTGGIGNEGDVPFPNGKKPIKLINRILISSETQEQIVLDFFAGSGSTAQAVLELNKEDGGNRKFILVQIPEKTDENSEAYKAGYKKISDICIERVKRVSNKLKEEKTAGDLGFKVFTLSSSYFPENLFTPDPEKTEEENKKALAKYIEEASTQLEFKFDEFDLMYEVLLKDGFTLNFKAEKLSEFTKNNIYKVTDGEKHAYMTLDGDLKDETLQKLQSYTEERFICLERAVDTTRKWNLQNMFGSNLWVI